jgi:outer membrane protein OmpA-like peptidoglycan-associated protein
MLSSGSGGQPKVAGGRVQAGCGRVSGTSGLRYRRLAPLAALSLAGCASFPSSMNPVSWWHDLQGGKIAEERPPPPGADQPYPNLASVPPKPEQPDRAALANIASALIADRTNAQHEAAANPIPDPSLPSASPALFGRGTVPPPTPPAPPGSPQASATMAAAEAPPAPAATNRSTTVPEAAPAPAMAPVASVQSAPLAPPGATAQPPAAEAAPPPPLPTGPPALPNLPRAGSTTPSSVAAATEPTRQPAASAASPPTTVAAATPPSTSAANTVSVTFVTGSTALPASAADSLKQLAAKRGSGIIAVTGGGDATANDPDAQSAALTLGLSRAQAMAAVLTSAGVPSSAVQVDAAASGRGGTARLVQ